jgi:hypothetical protein
MKRSHLGIAMGRIKDINVEDMDNGRSFVDYPMAVDRV